MQPSYSLILSISTDRFCSGLDFLRRRWKMDVNHMDGCDMNLIDRVEIILVETSEGGNVGSCARVLKNMGFRSFCLVDPRYRDHDQAKKLAVHAGDVLDRARVVPDLQTAVSSAHWVVGVSARVRAHPERKPPMEPAGFLDKLGSFSDTRKRVALVFGPEKSGLSNEQLGKCQDILCLPTSSEYPSMNLAQAVAVMAWEIRRAHLAGCGRASRVERCEPASSGEIDGLIRHAEYTLGVIGYLNPQNPRLIMDDLRKVFLRAELDSRETRMLRGIFHCMDVWASKHGGPPTPNQVNHRRVFAGSRREYRPGDQIIQCDADDVVAGRHQWSCRDGRINPKHSK